MPAADIFDNQQEPAGPGAARCLAQQFVDSLVTARGRLLTRSQHEGEDPDFACPEDRGPLHGRIQQLPLRLDDSPAFGRVRGKRDLEEARVQNGDAYAALVENGLRLPHLLHRLIRIIRSPDVANFDPRKTVAAQEFGGNQRVVVDLVAGNAQLETRKRQGPKTASERHKRGGGELTACKEAHPKIIAAGGGPGRPPPLWARLPSLGVRAARAVMAPE